MSQLFPAWLGRLIICHKFHVFATTISWSYPLRTNLCRVLSGVRIHRLYTHVPKGEGIQRRRASSIPALNPQAHTLTRLCRTAQGIQPPFAWDRGLPGGPRQSPAPSRQRRGPGRGARRPRRRERRGAGRGGVLARVLNRTRRARERAAAAGRRLRWRGQKCSPARPHFLPVCNPLLPPQTFPRILPTPEPSRGWRGKGVCHLLILLPKQGIYRPPHPPQLFYKQQLAALNIKLQITMAFLKLMLKAQPKTKLLVLDIVPKQGMRMSLL